MAITIEDLFRKAKTVSLNSAEQATIRERITRFMVEHPAGDSAYSLAAEERENETAHSFWFIFGPLRGAAILIIFFAILLSGTGLAIASEFSKPGDALYPLKTKLNKKISDLSAFAAKTKARWNTWQIEQKLNEADNLAADGKLTAEYKARAEESIKNYTKNLNNNLEDLAKENNLSDAADIASSFESVVSAHQKILNGLSRSEDARAMANNLKENAESAKKTREELVNKLVRDDGQQSDAYRQGLDRAKNSLEDLKIFSDKHEDIAEHLTKAAEVAQQKINDAAIAGRFGHSSATLNYLSEAYKVAKESKMVGEAKTYFKGSLPTSTLAPDDDDEVKQKDKRQELPIDEALDSPAPQTTQ